MILSMLTALIISSMGVYPQEVPANVLRGSVTEYKDLPQEFYGKWAVKSTLIETNNPDFFGTKSVDVWVFYRNKEAITLANPLSGASATITVDESFGKKTKFFREKIKEDAIETEIVDLTIEGNRFYGEDKQIIKHYSNNKLSKTDVVKYRVEGKKFPNQY